jgi:hypothetical protein
MLIERQDLPWFADEVAAQRCMPPVYRLLPHHRRGLPRHLLRVFLESRWDMIKEDPDPRRWAREFVKAGGPGRLAAFVFLLFGIVLFLATQGLQALEVSMTGTSEWVAQVLEYPVSLFCCSLCPLLVNALLVLGPAVYLYCTRNWLKR